MAQDAELDRLKDAQDRAFQRKQAAYDVMQRAWERRSTARDALDRAHAAKQSAYEVQDAAWQDLQRLRDHHGPRIEWLNRQQENAYQSMRDAFDRASAAHDAHDGASARMYADQGHSYKAESQGYVAERRQLIQELRDAKDRHEATRPSFQYAKSQFDDAKRNHDRAKAEHERKQEEFRRAKAEFDAAVKAFKARLEKVRAESQRRRQDKRSIAERAGVPFQYRDSVWVSRDRDGTYNIYFGGVGKPNGPGHGHYVMDQNWNVTYRRDPFDPHGGQNFERSAEAERKLGRIAMDAWARRQTTKRVIQYQDEGCTVKVRSGYDRDHNAITTDVIVAERHGADEHYHLIIDESGNVLFSEWRKNR